MLAHLYRNSPSASGSEGVTKGPATAADSADSNADDPGASSAESGGTSITAGIEGATAIAPFFKVTDVLWSLKRPRSGDTAAAAASVAVVVVVAVDAEDTVAASEEED